MKDLKDISEEVRKAHREKCSKCGTRKWYAKHLDMHFDYIDCPYDCRNDLEHLLKEGEEDE